MHPIQAAWKDDPLTYKPHHWYPAISWGSWLPQRTIKVFCLAQRGSLIQLKIFFCISCNGMTISTSSSVKYLGITRDNTFCGDSIASNIITKANGRLKILYSHLNSLNFRSHKTLTSALIRCHFDYACSSWYSALSQKYKNQLQGWFAGKCLISGPDTLMSYKQLNRNSVDLCSLRSYS